MASVYCNLVAGCFNIETEKVKSITAPAVFETKEYYNDFIDDLGDYGHEAFNDWLENNGYKGWIVEDCIEVEKLIEKSQMPDKAYILINNKHTSK